MVWELGVSNGNIIFRSLRAIFCLVEIRCVAHSCKLLPLEIGVVLILPHVVFIFIQKLHGVELGVLKHNHIRIERGAQFHNCVILLRVDNLAHVTTS